MDKLKFVKALVFFLTATIIFGMILAGVTIYKKVKHTKSAETVTLNLNQPQNSRIADIKTTDGAIHLLIANGQKNDRVISVRTSDYSTIAVINLN